MDNSLKDALLKSIELSGATAPEKAEVIIHINKEIDKILDRSSGLSRIRPALLSQFQLALEKPLTLSAISNLSIHCFHCGRIISYPAWILVRNYTKSQLYYFLCCNSEVGRATLHCK